VDDYALADVTALNPEKASSSSVAITFSYTISGNPAPSAWCTVEAHPMIF